MAVCAVPCLAITAAAEDNDSNQPETRSEKIFDEVVYYDGYNSKVFDADLRDGIIRHANHLYAKKLTDAELNWMGEDLTVKVQIGALCDNYDRIGNINVAFVPKGQEGYNPDETTRIELARFITPFMDKNKKPDHVPYEFRADNMSLIFRDATLRTKYDYYMEFELFGVPYAANQQITGCKDRNDVFTGTLEFYSDSKPAEQVDNHVLVPIVMKRPEFKGHNMNNYSEQGTDTIGVCTKTWKFEVPADLTDARLVLVMSNHGANANGEEYSRRRHFIYLDKEQIDLWTPGGKSCEPYRKYNTQANGIYGSSTQSEREWKMWNNWCPGDAIPIREFDLGQMKAGEHSVTIRVPTAKFANGQGDFPVSMYLQGVKDGKLPSGLEIITPDVPSVDFKIENNIFMLVNPEGVARVEIYDANGQLWHATNTPVAPINLRDCTKGVHIVVVTLTDGRNLSRKVVL